MNFGGCQAVDRRRHMGCHAKSGGISRMQSRAQECVVGMGQRIDVRGFPQAPLGLSKPDVTGCLMRNDGFHQGVQISSATRVNSCVSLIFARNISPRWG